jgi:hypothetical protein
MSKGCVLAPARHHRVLWRLLLAAALVAGVAGTTTAAASGFTYDIPTIARHGVQSLDIVEAGSGQFTEAHARSASPPTSSRGTSTTPSPRRVATKADDVIGAVCSFSGDTDVLMADGTRKRIDEIEVGDMVVATDPETGETKAREVVATLPHSDQLVTLDTSVGEIVTTEDHRYWNLTDGEWQAAQGLDSGDRLLAASGASVVVEGLDWSTLHTTTAYDLDVQGIDTFYVGAGEAEVLVHNCDSLPVLGHRNVLEGPLPAGNRPLSSWTQDDLLQLQDDLTTSIANRQAEIGTDFPFDPSDYIHPKRIQDEIDLLRAVEKALSGS